MDVDEYPGGMKDLRNEVGKRISRCLKYVYPYLLYVWWFVKIAVVIALVVIPLYNMTGVERFRFFVKDVPEILVMIVGGVIHAYATIIREIFTVLI